MFGVMCLSHLPGQGNGSSVPLQHKLIDCTTANTSCTRTCLKMHVVCTIHVRLLGILHCDHRCMLQKNGGLHINTQIMYRCIESGLLATSALGAQNIILSIGTQHTKTVHRVLTLGTQFVHRVSRTWMLRTSQTRLTLIFGSYITQEVSRIMILSIRATDIPCKAGYISTHIHNSCQPIVKTCTVQQSISKIMRKNTPVAECES